MKPEVWHAIIGVVLAGVGLVILGGVAYVLYGPGFSLSFLTSNQATSTPEVGVEGAQVYVCKDMIVTTRVAGEGVQVELSDGRKVAVTLTPIPEGVEVPPDAWDRYATPDGSFVLWKRDMFVLIQENSIVTHGECALQAQ